MIPPFPGNDIHLGKPRASLDAVVDHVKIALTYDQERANLKKLNTVIQSSSRSVKVAIRHAMKSNSVEEVLKIAKALRQLNKRK